ncbi:MAG: hypothetical protein U1A25_01540 [Candidatus Sungbacteria bacterium]|nr:hypothetical protein [bacterium]MDZ4260324.1 hypothetical protein [Candidatus Sungbacteria bacterium]
MAVFVPFYITCSFCGHRNRLHPSPREGVRLALIGHAGSCKSCGKVLKPKLSDRPLVRRIRAELQDQGIKTVC